MESDFPNRSRDFPEERMAELNSHRPILGVLCYIPRYAGICGQSAIYFILRVGHSRTGSSRLGVDSVLCGL